MDKVYFISGLGADKRIFQKLELSAEFQAVYLDWVNVLPGDSLETYVKRLGMQISESSPVILVGVSFGGIVALELAKILRIKKVIIISSLQQYTDLPFLYKLAGVLNIHKIIPSIFFTWPNLLSFYLFGASMPETRVLLKTILQDTDPCFLKWAILQILSRRVYEIPNHFYHIHGTADMILPKVPSKAIRIRGGGHLMVFENAAEVSSVLNKVLLSD